MDASRHIEQITELLKDNRASVQLKGYDFVNMSDEQINQMFHNDSHNFTAPPLHYRREVSQLRHWSSNKLGKEERRSKFSSFFQVSVFLHSTRMVLWLEWRGPPSPRYVVPVRP